ncbi:MAG: acyl-CoA/acyl-ACP dehydrogenase [Candidatus Tectomicrobia bacterium]|uniref:Acyl-CoA/acyl-ACP dehydrogenase n=1 Tax=Tectimicrobiota bacterium TaxID=2528274 RepID=A0A933GL59_UNCTE|nr:acyl-CoA/acyl-ACP dehydrogenase [Candidatus Tectomicrobia bacterium]
MIFKFNEDQELFYQTVHDFMDKEIGRDYVRKCDMEKLYPHEAYEKVAKQGWLGILIPEEYGGSGGDAILYTIFNEAMGKYNVDFGECLGGGSMIMMNILLHGSEEQKRYYLPKFIRGEQHFSISITEPNAGSDAASLLCSAVPDGDDFVLNGQKVFSTGAHIENNTIIMAARTDKNAPKHKGISLFLVDNKTPGLTFRRLNTLAKRTIGTNEVFIDEVRVSRKNLIGKLNEGWKYLTSHLALERICLAGIYVGAAQTAVHDAMRYAKERIQFNQPIAQFQVIKHMLVDMQVEVDAARLLVYRAAWMHKEGQECVKEAAIAKLYSSEMLLRVSTHGMQILGGYAQMPEYDMERHFREAKQAMVGGGTSQIQRNIIAKAMGL